MANKILNENSKGLTLDQLNLGLKTVDKLIIDESEKRKIGWKQIAPSEGEPGGRIEWKDPNYKKEIQFSDDEYKFLKEKIEKRDEEKKYSLDEGRPMVSLVDKVLEAKKEKGD